LSKIERGEFISIFVLQCTLIFAAATFADDAIENDCALAHDAPYSGSTMPVQTDEYIFLGAFSGNRIGRIKRPD